MSLPSATSAPRDIDVMAVRSALRRLSTADAPPWVHAEAARRLAERLQFIKLKPEAVLDWWSFGGAGAALLRKAYPAARLIAVEPTEPLRERSLRALKAAWWSPRRWQSSDTSVMAPDEVPPRSVQLVWSNMMVHSSMDPAALFSRWQAALAADGFVMFSCLGPGTLRPLRELYARCGWGDAMADLVDMHDLGDMLVHAGFADPVMDQETVMLSWDGPEALLRELRSMGANASPARSKGLRTPQWHARLKAELMGLADSQGRINMPFEIAYGHAFKAQPKVAVARETSVSLEAMRAMVQNKPQRG